MVGTSDLRFLWTDLTSGIEWKEARRAVLQPGQEEDGWRKVLVVNRLHPGQPAANCRVIHPGDKLVTVDTGNGPRILVGLGLKHLKRMLEPIKSGVLTLEFLRANDVCKLAKEITDEHVQRPYTFAVELDLDDVDSDQSMKPASPVHVSFPPLPPSSPSNSSRPSSRPKTTSWACTEDPQDPRSTRPLNANRFERLLFVVNCKLKEKSMLQLLCDSYELDRPQTGIQSRPGLRACYRLKRWWNEEEQDALQRMLMDLITWGHVDKVKDVVSIVQEHIATAARQYPLFARTVEAEAAQLREEEAEQRATAAEVVSFEEEEEEEGGELAHGGHVTGELGPIVSFSRKPTSEAGAGSSRSASVGGVGSRPTTEAERSTLKFIEEMADDMSASLVGGERLTTGGERPTTGAERSTLHFIEQLAEKLSSSIIEETTELLDP